MCGQDSGVFPEATEHPVLAGVTCVEVIKHILHANAGVTVMSAVCSIVGCAMPGLELT